MIRNRLVMLLVGITLCVTLSRCAQIVLNTGMVMVSVPYFLVVGPYAAVDYAKRGRSGEYGCVEARFSENGQYVALILREKQNGGKYQHLYLLSLSTNKIEQLTAGKRNDIDLAFSPDSKFIVFSTVARDSENSKVHAELNVIDIGGANMEQIHTGNSIYYSPVFSGDGSKIAVNIENKIYVMNSDGSNSVLLSNTDGGDVKPTFTRDSENVVFWRARYFGSASPMAYSGWRDVNLYIASIESGESRPLHNTGLNRLQDHYTSPGASHMIWVGDDKRVFFASYSDSNSFDGPHEFAPKGPPFTYFRAGEERQRLFHDPIISPDGKFVLLGISTGPPKQDAVIMEWQSPSELHIVNIATGAGTQLTQLGGRIVESNFSPDGSKILFRKDPKPSNSRKTIELWVINSDGSDLRQIDFD